METATFRASVCELVEPGPLFLFWAFWAWKHHRFRCREMPCPRLCGERGQWLWEVCREDSKQCCLTDTAFSCRPARGRGLSAWFRCPSLSNAWLE